MRYTTLWTLPWIAVTAAVATAEDDSPDYRKIDRSIVKEPEYSSGEPLYGLMLFGRQATFRVWIVLDGETIYVDRNGDGDLTTEDERFSPVKDCRNVELGASSETAVYTIAAIGRYEHGEPASIRLMRFVKIAGPPEYQQYGGLTMENSPRKTKVAHFDGPLTISWEPELGASLSLRRSPVRDIRTGRHHRPRRGLFGRRHITQRRCIRLR